MVKVDHKQAALDFLSFVNASPTRKNNNVLIRPPPSNILQRTMLSSPAKTFLQLLDSKKSKCVNSKKETLIHSLPDRD